MKRYRKETKRFPSLRFPDKKVLCPISLVIYLRSLTAGGRHLGSRTVSWELQSESRSSVKSRERNKQPKSRDPSVSGWEGEAA